MTIAVYGEKASRTHENQMLQAFLERLEPRWGTSTDWIVVIANSLWNGAEIDLVCILPSAIYVADFKSHGGKLTGTENGNWLADGVIVKGGRKANPYQQLRDNKFSVLNWLESKALLSGRSLGHISAGILFARGIDDQVDLPPKVRSWFHSTDLNNCAGLLDCLASTELLIDRKEALNIVHRLGAQPMEWVSSGPKVRDIDPRSAEPDTDASLTRHQQEALHGLSSFFSSENSITFSVLGMTSTGKSWLLAAACREIRKSGRTPIVLAPNRRLAVPGAVEPKSIYAHLYAGAQAEDKDEDGAAERSEQEAKPDVIGMRICNDDLDCVYLLDDAHLLGNSRFTTPDGKRYGSGHLLDDFHAFTELGKGKRQAVFFGDPYQIQRSGDGESVLLGQYQKSRGLSHQSVELSQVIDTTGGSAKLINAERLVKAIRSQRFAELDLQKDEGFRQIEKQDAAREILGRYRSDPCSVWYLAETHLKTNALNQWVRERLHGKKLLASLEVGDLLEIYVSPESQDSTTASGSRRLAASVGVRKSYEQPLKGRKAPVVFHSALCKLEGGEPVHLEILEEFLLSEKQELSADIAIAERVRRRTIEPPPLTEFAYVRYGYASTVHHAQGMSRPICFVNCEHAAGRHSEGFYRWLYSALSVATRELVLLNFTEIHAFDSAVWNTGAAVTAADIPIGMGWSFEPHGIASVQDQRRDLPHGLDQSRNPLVSAAIWLRVANSAERHGWKVERANCHTYQEQYDLVGPMGEREQLRISYNGKNVVTAMHVKNTANWTLLCEVASGCLETNGYSAEAGVLLRSARSRLDGKGWKIVSAIETAYLLRIVAVRGPDERVSVDVNFDKQGLASTLRALQASDLKLLDQVKEALL